MKKFLLSVMCICLSFGLFAQTENKDELTQEKPEFWRLANRCF